MNRGVKLALSLIIMTMVVAFIGGLKVEAACQHEQTEIETRGVANHTLKCKICKEIVATVPHDEKVMYWEEHGNGHRYKCKVCGKVLDEQPHNFEDSWGYDDTYHWPKCRTCGAEETLQKREHVDDGNGKCSECGKTLEIVAGKDISTATYVAEHCDKGCTTMHYTYGTAYECYMTCEGEHVKWPIGNHSGTPNCTKKQTCTICGYMYWLEHDYVNGECTMCHAKEPVEPTATPTSTPTSTPTVVLTTAPTTTPTTAPTGNWQKDVYYHWQAGGQKELHKPIPATCTEPISCICGATVGKPKGHQYSNKGVCTVCGASKGNEPSTPVQKNVPFDDVNPGSWYYENGSVKFVTDRGYIEGLSSNKFGPDVDMTRGNFIKMLYIIEGEPKVSQTDVLEIYKEFSDITNENRNDKENKLLNAIIWGRKNNIMNGLGNGQFGTDESISRQQMAVALKRYVEYRGEDTSKTPRANLANFDDGRDVYNWAKDAVAWAISRKIISGSNNKLTPQANATRAQVATMIMNYLTK